MPRKASSTSRTGKRAEAPASSFPGHDDIAQRAYQLFVNRGMAAGFEQEDWRQAEQELLDRAARKIAVPKRA
jgi:Protein of unknown function (DUF2934)